MNQYKHSPFDEEILDAIIKHNLNKPSSEKFTLVDVRVISLIHSYCYASMPFYASNQYLAERCLTTPATIQKSINRLLAHGLITKQVSCVDGHKQRILIYDEPGTEKFKRKYNP